jgi:hypothetical protein
VLAVRRIAVAALIGMAALAGGFGAAVLASSGAIEGTSYTYDVTLTGFYSCPCTNVHANFGDGATTDVALSPAVSTITFSAPHVYSTAGVYTYGLTVASCVSACPKTQTGTTPVADAQITGTGGPPIAVNQGAPFSGALGHFTDADPTHHPASAYTATVDWGDGTTSPATITSSGTGFDVSGSHTWAAAGTFAVHTTVVDHPGAGVAVSSAALTETATVASTAPPPSPEPPHAVIAPVVQPVLAGFPVAFSGAGSTGAGPLTYTWTFCTSADRTTGCAPGSPTDSGVTVTHPFTPAPVHDLKHFPRADPKRRRSSTIVVLTVTDALGRTSSASQEVTVIPDLAPKTNFEVGPQHLIGQDDVTVTPEAFDPDHNDSVKEEDWDFTGDGSPDVICTAFKGCKAVDPRLQVAITLGSGTARATSRAHSTATARAHSAKTPQKKTTPTVKASPTAVTKVTPKAELAFQAAALHGALLAFPAFRWNFARAALAAEDLAPLPSIDLSGFDDAGRATFLRDFGYEIFNESPLGQGEIHRPAKEIHDSKFPQTEINFPQTISMTAVDAEGQSATQVLPVGIRNDSGPSARFTQVPGTKSVPTAGDTINFDMSGVGDADGGVAWYVLEASPNPPRDSTTGSSYCQIEGPLSTGKGSKGKGPHTVGDPNDPSPNATNGFPKKPKLPTTSTDTTPPPPPVIPAGGHVQEGLAALLAGTPIERYCSHDQNPSVFGAGTITVTGQSPQAVDHIALPTPGQWSVSITAYDVWGMPARRILYPITVAAADGSCQALPPTPVRPGAIGKKLTIGLSGDCVSKVSDANQTVYTSPKPVDVDGVTLAPTPGDTLVFVDDSSGGLIFSTSVAFDPSLSAADWLTAAKKSVTGAQVRLDGDTVGSWSKFGIIQAENLFSGTPLTVPIPDGAQYRTLPVADGSLTVEADADQHSELKLRTTLPEVMGAGNSQGQVDVQASNVASVPVAGASDPGDAARRRALRAHAADAAAGLNSMPLDATSIGPIKIPGGTSFTYDPGTQTWHDSISGLTLPGLELAGGNATLDLVVKGTSLISATGTLHVSDPGIPVATGVFLTSIDFTLVTSPNVSISAGAGITVGGIVSGHGELTIQPDPVDVRVAANLTVLGFLPLGSGFVEFTSGSLSFGGEAGYNFGPASLNASVEGGVNLQTKQFYVLGSGKACLFACVSAQAIVSSVGVAACGEVDLVLTSVEIGIGYRTPDDLSLWIDSCGLESFKVPLTSSSRAVAAKSTGLSKTIGAGSTRTIQVPAGLKELAIQAQAPAGVNAAPHVTLVGPKKDPRTATNPAQIGDYSFGLEGATAGNASKEGTMLVDENPLDGATSIIVAKPAAGAWTLHVAADSVPVASVRTAKPIDPTSVSKSMVTIHKGVGAGGTMVVGSRFVTVAKGAHAAAKAHPHALVAASALPKLEQPRIRRLSYDIKTGDGGVALVDEGPSGSIVLARGAAHGTRSGSVAFDPAGAGTHTIRAVTLDSNGLPISSKVVETYKAPPLPKPGPPGIVKIVNTKALSYIELDHGPADPDPNALAYYVRLRATGGIAQGFVVLDRDVRHRDGHPIIALHGIPPGAKINAHVRASFGGKVSAASKRG